MRYDDQPTEYDARDATTAAPVPEAGEDEWSPLAESDWWTSDTQHVTLSDTTGDTHE